MRSLSKTKIQLVGFPLMWISLVRMIQKQYTRAPGAERRAPKHFEQAVSPEKFSQLFVKTIMKIEKSIGKKYNKRKYSLLIIVFGIVC